MLLPNRNVVSKTRGAEEVYLLFFLNHFGGSIWWALGGGDWEDVGIERICEYLGIAQSSGFMSQRLSY